MQFYFGHSLLKTIIENPSFLLEIRTHFADLNEIALDWEGLLSLTGLDSLFVAFPLESPLLDAVIKELAQSDPSVDLFTWYDRVFVECLSWIKAQPHLSPSFFIEAIDHLQKSLNAEQLSLFQPALQEYAQRFRESPGMTMHDLLLHLGWDRTCAFFRAVFDYQSPPGIVFEGLSIFKECLLESFYHITYEGKTRPSFWKLLEALYAYDMREEKLQQHSEATWQILCEASAALRDPHALCDVPYVDLAIHLSDKAALQATAVTDVSEKRTTAALKFGRYIFDDLLKSHPEWQLKWSPIPIIKT